MPEMFSRGKTAGPMRGTRAQLEADGLQAVSSSGIISRNENYLQAGLLFSFVNTVNGTKCGASSGVDLKRAWNPLTPDLFFYSISLNCKVHLGHCHSRTTKP